MNHYEALIALNMTGDIGSRRLARLKEVFGSPEKACQAGYDLLVRIEGITKLCAQKIAQIQLKRVDEELAKAKAHGVRIVTSGQDEYPSWLRQIPDFPIVLYVKGTLDLKDEQAIGIVGSRKASFYGISCAGNFARELAYRGLTIVSGMARGIDTAAHTAALKAGGRTIAVMGSGFCRVYPRENIGLAKQISESGAVVSEFPMEIAPLPANFPRRNRIISGLAKSVLVVEAARNSGALITADYALEQGKDVFALPGKVDSANAFGTNELIKQGAKLVSTVEDVLDEFPVAPANKAYLPPAINDTEFTGEEERVFQIISSQPCAIDDIIEKAGISVQQAAEILMMLELKKAVKQLPGKQYAKN